MAACSRVNLGTGTILRFAALSEFGHSCGFVGLDRRLEFVLWQIRDTDCCLTLMFGEAGFGCCTFTSNFWEVTLPNVLIGSAAGRLP